VRGGAGRLPSRVQFVNCRRGGLGSWRQEGPRGSCCPSWVSASGQAGRNGAGGEERGRRGAGMVPLPRWSGAVAAVEWCRCRGGFSRVRGLPTAQGALLRDEVLNCRRGGNGAGGVREWCRCAAEWCRGRGGFSGVRGLPAGEEALLPAQFLNCRRGGLGSRRRDGRGRGGGTAGDEEARGPGGGAGPGGGTAGCGTAGAAGADGTSARGGTAGAAGADGTSARGGTARTRHGARVTRCHTGGRRPRRDRTVGA